MLIDLILINMLAQFVPHLQVTFYTYVEGMVHKFSKIKSFKQIDTDNSWFSVKLTVVIRGSN